jgi:hypothetical protein
VKNSILLLFLLPFLFLSCSKDKELKGVFIRVQNQTDQKVSNTSIFSFSADLQSEREERYGSIPPGKITSYRQYQFVYNIPVLKSEMEGYGAFEVMPRCGNGLSTLADGKYSLIIKISGNYPYAYFEKE